MPMFFLTHYFPRNFQGSPETAAAATAWFARLGDNLTARGNPQAETRSMGNCSNEPDRMLAYTLITADDLQAATALAEAWPLLARGGGVEVRELTTLKPPVLISPSA